MHELSTRCRDRSVRGKASPGTILGRSVAIVGLTLLVGASPLLAQTVAQAVPWLVRVTPTMDPLPIGFCAAVQLSLVDPATKDVPRRSSGIRVSMADFDLAVSSPDPRAAAGEFMGANFFRICACQAATIGAVATITATYPAQSLAAKDRVRGVALQATATTAMSASKGGAQPPPCAALQSTTVAAATTPQTAVPITGAPVLVTGRTAGGAPAAVPNQRGGSPRGPVQQAPGGAPISNPPVQAGLPRGGGANTPLAAAPAGTPGPRQSPAGAPPTGVQITATPLVATLTWTAAPNAARYSVWRKDGPPVSVEQSGPALTATTFVDTLPSAITTYVYTVSAHYADGTSGAAPGVSFTTPPLLNPTGFTATLLTNGKVQLQWQAMPGASRYLLTGPGVPNNGSVYQTATSQIAQLLPMGPLSWKVFALYPGNNADYSTGSVATAMVRALPIPGAKWLSKNNGVGTPAQATAHMNQFCVPPVSCFGTWRTRYPDQGWVFHTWGDPQRSAVEAVYGNVEDLGVGRRTHCFAVAGSLMAGGPTTVCYSTSHGPGPGEPGFGNEQVITRAAMGVQVPTYDSLARLHNPWGGQPRSATIIIKNQLGSTFLAMTVGTWELSDFVSELDAAWWYPSWLASPQSMTSLVLDSEGSKQVPHSCIACHGGQYNPTTKRVTGASLLPLDPSSLVFPVSQPRDRDQAGRQVNEERIRQINELVMNSAPTSAVANYIRELYKGNVSSPGTKATDDFVPSGWSQQAGLYRQVVKPYCSSCHLAAPSNINFASWNNFLANKALIHNAVCVQRTMPHSEIAFKAFWTKDTGPLYLPGLLAASLGYPKC